MQYLLYDDDDRPLKKQYTGSCLYIYIGQIILSIQFDNYSSAYEYMLYLDANNHLYLDYYVVLNNKYDDEAKQLLNNNKYIYEIK
jgi:hypothetical protein